MKVLKVVTTSPDLVHFTLEKNTPGIGFEKCDELLMTSLKGGVSDMEFTREDNVGYYEFLASMVVRTHDVTKRVARLVADRIVFDKHKLIEALEIVDPTFKSPEFNMHCRWQMELLDCMCSEWVPTVIAGVRNKHRLCRFINRCLKLD